MPSNNKVFQITFFISLIAHGAILWQNPNFNFFPKDKKETNLEVSYVKRPIESKEPLKTITPKREPFLKLSAQVTVENRTPPPFIDKENFFKGVGKVSLSDPGFAKPVFNKPDIIAIKKKITLPPIDINKINNPSYISYYQIVREKIKRSAYQNYTGKEVGEATVLFVISCDGYLKDLRLKEENSRLSTYLRETALKSIKEASPFPNFPKELDYPQLSFNLTITFEIE